jgi:hypothetical protein
MVKSIGKPDALNAPVRFDVAGTGNVIMAAGMRPERKRRNSHRCLTCARQFSTLLETFNTDADPPVTRGRPKLTEEYERMNSVGSVGVLATTCMYRKAHGTRDAPAVEPEDRDQPATRESQAGLSGAAEGIVVPMIPDNAGGGKGPYF